jgi:hypothetical protein
MVFDEVKKARPAKLFLYQDGPRGERDMEGIEGCRQIVSDEQIDWECEVHRLYQEKNYGCDPSEYLSQKWAFSHVEKCIVLEDDDVPSQSFFPFCKELLDRYENDERIGMIAGFNSDEVTEGVPYDYFFTTVFSIWGWASWRRVIDQWDSQYTFLDDEYGMKQTRNLWKERKYRSYFLDMCEQHRKSGKEYYETIFGMSLIHNHQLAIMPTKNLVNNYGVTEDSTHFTANLNTIPKRLKKVFTMKRFELEFPLKHPRYVIEDIDYKHHVYRTNAWGHPWIKMRYSLEELWNNLRYGNFKMIGRAIRNRLGIMFGGKKFK